MQADALPYGVIAVGMHLFIGNGEILFRIIDHQIRILADGHSALILAAEDPCRIGSTKLHCLFKGDLSCIGRRQHVGIHIFNTGTAVGHLGEIVLAPVLLIALERTVIRCQRGDNAGVDGVPQSLPAFLPFHGRRTDKVPAVRPLVYLTGKFQVLGTGFCVDFIALLLRPGHGLHTLFIGEMHNIQGCLQSLCPLDRPHIRLCLYKFRPGQIMIPGTGLALSQVFLYTSCNNIPVFRMHLNQGAAAFCFFQHLIEHAVIHTEIIHHKHLEGGYPVCYSLLQGIQQPAGHILYRNMKCIVYRRIRRTHRIPALDGIHHGLAEILHGKIEHSGGAAAGSCSGACKIVI